MSSLESDDKVLFRLLGCWGGAADSDILPFANLEVLKANGTMLNRKINEGDSFDIALSIGGFDVSVLVAGIESCPALVHLSFLYRFIVDGEPAYYGLLGEPVSLIDVKLGMLESVSLSNFKHEFELMEAAKHSNNFYYHKLKKLEAVL